MKKPNSPPSYHPNYDLEHVLKTQKFDLNQLTLVEDIK